ncbi:MAG TPA: hypothetical protein VGL10_03640 [Gammaproteobacteria bacterium]
MKFPYWLPFIAVSLLSACGGGGGGGGSADNSDEDNGSSSPDPSSSAVFDLAEDAVSFTAISNGSTPAQKIVIGTLTGTDDAYVFMQPSGGVIADVDFDSAGETGSFILIPRDPEDLGYGVHHGKVKVKVCSDKKCKHHISGSPQDIAVTYKISPALIVTPAEVLLGGEQGRDPSPQPLEFSIDTGSDEYPWTISLQEDDDGTWLQNLSADSGDVSEESVTLSLYADPENIDIGIYTATATINVTVDGELITTDVPIVFKRDAHKLLASDVGIALASMPALSNLAHTVRINDSFGYVDTPWEASADQDWLSITESGVAGGNLQITANPSGLAPNTIHYANITVSSSDPSIENTETIRVGFWVNNSNPLSSNTVTASYGRIIADPIRPYVYVSTFSNNSIYIYNVYTAALVNTISIAGVSFPDTILAGMAIDQSGSILYVMDGTFISDPDRSTRVYPINLDTRVVGESWTSAPKAPSELAYARPNGVGIIFANDRYAYRAENGSQLNGMFGAADIGSSIGNRRYLATSVDSSTLCGINDYELLCHRIGYSLTAEDDINFLQTADSNDGGADVAVNADGTQVYVASREDSFLEFAYTTTDVNQLSLPHKLTAAYYTESVEIDAKGRLVGSADSSYGPKDVWVYDDNVLLGSYYLSGYAKHIVDRGVVPSADGLRIIAITTDPSIKFINAP